MSEAIKSYLMAAVITLVVVAILYRVSALYTVVTGHAYPTT